MLPCPGFYAGAASGVRDVLLAAAPATAAAPALLLLLLLRTSDAVLFCCVSSPHGVGQPAICFVAESLGCGYFFFFS